MSFNPMTEKGIPIDRQLRSWSEMNVQPYDTYDVDPYTRCRVIAMNGIEVEAVMNSHNTARRTANTELKSILALTRRIEQQQQRAVGWLVPGQESNIAHTIAYEQVAVDLTAWVARHEPDPYLKQVYDFGLLEDFDHLYRYANLMDLMGEGRKAQDITGGLTEIIPGRPTIFEHRHPHDDIRRPMTITAADAQSVMNALTVLSAEQQTMNYYMTTGNRPEDPLARALYLEIAEIEEQHVTQYESILDPTVTELENLVLHEYNECWLYWSCMQTETDRRISKLWELHLNMEIEHLRVACQAMKDIDGRDAAEILPAGGMAEPLKFEPNKDYVRKVLRETVDLTADGADFVSIEKLPPDHRYFGYQSAVNEGSVPSETVIHRHAANYNGEYRHATEGEHPVKGLRESPEGETQYARVVGL